MLTPTEAAASAMITHSKCESCTHVSNVKHNGIAQCKHGFSPKRCAIYQEKQEISLDRLRRAFK